MRFSKLRLCVDYPEDLELLRKIHAACKSRGHWEDAPPGRIGEEQKKRYPMYGIFEVLHCMNEHPEWANINSMRRQVG